VQNRDSRKLAAGKSPEGRLQLSNCQSVLNLRLKTPVKGLAGILAATLCISSLGAQPKPGGGTPTAAGIQHHYQPDRFAGRAGRYYTLVWGVGSLSVKAVEAGELIRFSYEVLDATKAGQLGDKKLEPKLVAPAAHAILVVPSLEKVGKLRQSNTPEAGKSYWMAFSNPHRTVKRGDRVNVVIGQFHADGLVVE
jgi:hypothetical protein